MVKVASSGGRVNTVELDTLPDRFNAYTLGNPRREGNYFVCGFMDSDHSRFVRAPDYVFNAVARDELANIGDLKNYRKEHPAL